MREIYRGIEMREKLLSGINQMADTVVLTMGPNGKTVGITDFNGKGYITKDGVSVANDITFKDYIEEYGAELMKQVAQKTVEEAGDGTTTSICLARELIVKGYELLDNGVSYNDIKEALDILEKDVVEHIKINTKKLTKKDIINVATISANNDKHIGNLINNAYKHSSIVRVEESYNAEDSLETINGMQLDTTYAHKAFINNEKKKAIVYDKCKFIIIDGKLETVRDIEFHLKGPQELPVIIMADHFSESIISIFRTNFNENRLSIGLIKSPNMAGQRRNVIEDLIKYFKLEMKNNVNIGTIDAIYADDKKVILAKDDVNKAGAGYLKQSLKVENDKSLKRLLQERIDNLEGSLSIIKVGGNSELEMKERKDRIDDAVLAVKSAFEEGIVEGGGVLLAKFYIKDKKLTEYILRPFIELSKCLYKPYSQIFGENYNHADKNMFEENIVDPAKVTRCAFLNALSLARTILNMEAIVVNDRIWN